MQTHEENTRCSTESPGGKVQDIRRQWALHEDEAFAHRLQDEEINQHYAGNRTRNAIVREDAPRARVEQRREEQEALEQRLLHLSLLQRQAEEDARFAQKLAKKYDARSEDGSLIPDLLKEEIDDEERICQEIVLPCLYSKDKTESTRLGAAATCRPSTSQTAYTKDDLEEELTEDDIRFVQEQQDADLALRVQEEFEQYEKDRLLAIEAQDRELALSLYEKEKARLKRAKERSRLKAEAAASTNLDANSTEEISPSFDSNDLVSNRNFIDTQQRAPGHLSPPRIPEKFLRDNSVGFKANPKALPPQPPISRSSQPSTSRTIPSPVPPYMPIHGFNRNSPKRSK